ncbi:hypothetical protein [Burkholderia diffusa]|uniref:hypothetical protein n=1 Tax=Burkholderia diffusa TaxID=488732 RepID=UPI0012490369|nr:hypothetical protein [Burkholderia diffusa]KAB0661964.1 hypothetical protein F7R23_04855 [Burkholderia diffusa]MBM2656675.1 hypothetical protein [Burkholderia diffusa]
MKLQEYGIKFNSEPRNNQAICQWVPSLPPECKRFPNLSLDSWVSIALQNKIGPYNSFRDEREIIRMLLDSLAKNPSLPQNKKSHRSRRHHERRDADGPGTPQVAGST